MDAPARSGRAWAELVLRVCGAGLLLATAAIHLDLYLTGYTSIPTIGVLFLLQVTAAGVLGAVILASGSRLASAAGAGFALSTLGGYLLSLWIGLFGFREVRTTAGVVAGVIEIAAFATLAGLAISPTSRLQPASREPRDKALEQMQTRVGDFGRPVAALSIIAVLVLGISVALEGSGGATSSGAQLKLGRVGSAAVVTNARGFTLYWFAPDTATKSNCVGTCTAYWPPVIGHPDAGTGVTGKLGTIRRSGGAIQATYDGHPLYSYVGDGGPGQANGNSLDLNGGIWHEMAVSG